MNYKSTFSDGVSHNHRSWRYPIVKPILVSTADSGGGAARAAYRLHYGLREIGVQTQMIVQQKSSDEIDILAPSGMLDQRLSLLRPSFDKLPLRFAGQSRSTFSPGWTPSSLVRRVKDAGADVVNLHWTCAGFLRVEALRQIKQPIVWTLHDMWAFTGGCHYDQLCGRYEAQCGLCPQLNSRRESDLSRRIWRRKQKAWADTDLTIVCPSRWLADCAQQSSLFADRRVEVIPYGLDLEQYRPIDRGQARALLGLPQDKILILFGAIQGIQDPRKGFQHLQPALDQLAASSAWRERLALVVVGASQFAMNPKTPLPTHYLGRLHDDLSLALAYSAANIFVAPSTQDNLPNTIIEALACGTPCVAFDIGGMPDMIRHKQAGYLATPFDVQDLVYGIRWVLEDQDRWQRLSQQARTNAVARYAMERQSARYLNLFMELLQSEV